MDFVLFNAPDAVSKPFCEVDLDQVREPMGRRQPRQDKGPSALGSAIALVIVVLVVGTILVIWAVIGGPFHTR
jgi:hypothetical protein